MSQNTSLNTFEGNVRENGTLENLFITFSEENDHHKKSRILYSFVHTYVQRFKNELEINVISTEFFQSLSQIPVLCEKFLQTSEISCSDEVLNKNKNLESVSLCFDALNSCLEAFYMTNQCVILIKLALNILSQGYTHCKESEIIYGDLLEQFADQLGAFFKKIENLQTVVLQHIDKLDMTKYAEDDLEMNVVIVEMGNLCQIVFSLDADIAFEIWIKYKRIIAEYKTSKQISNINEISSYLVIKNIDLLKDIKCCLENNSEADEELAAKSFFYLNALTDLMNLIHGSFKGDLSLVRVLLDCLIFCYSPSISEKSSWTILTNSLKKNVFTLISHTCTVEEFKNCLLSLISDKEFYLSPILMKLCFLHCTENASLELREKAFRGILSDFVSNNQNDMKLLHIAIPRCTVTKTKSDELVTLYQLAYEIISESFKFMPDSLIEKLEATILEFLVSSCDVLYLLISDVWVYRLRCSSIEFFKERCYAVLQNLHIENINNHKLENLIKRMLRFLPDTYKDTLLDAFSSLRFIQESKNIQHRYGIPDHTSTETEIKINSEEQIKIMMYQLSDNSSNDAINFVKKACTCMELCALFVTVAECSEIMQFLELAIELFKTDIYEVQIATLTFLKSLSRKTMSEHNPDFAKIVIMLAQLFSEAMHSKNYIVKYEATNIFSYFAKCTPHTKIVQETVKKDPTLKGILRTYMYVLPAKGFLSEKDKMDYLQKQTQVLSRNLKFEIPSKAMDSLQRLFSSADWKTLI